MIFAIFISIILHLFADFAYTNQMLLGTAIVVFLLVLYFFNSKIANWFVGFTLFFGNFGLVTLLPFGSSFQINNFIIFDAFCTPLFIVYILINEEEVFSFVRWITYNDSN